MKVRFAVAPDGAADSAERLTAFAGAVERAGFDGVWLSDLPLGPMLDPLLGLSLIAGAARRLRLGANVVPLGRNPFLLARSLAQLDRLSGGRVLLSFVPGIAVPGERAALGWQGESRGAALEGQLAAVRALWSGAVPDGGDPVALAAVLAPVQDPLEVWLGGRGPRALERVGRIADGWLGAQLGPADAGAARRAIEAAAARAGREIDPEHYGLSIGYARTRPDTAHLEALAARGVEDPAAHLPVGAPALGALIDELLAAGLSKFVLRPAGAVADWEDEAGWLASAILDRQS